MRKFYVYATQTTDYRIEIEAETAEEAEKIAESDDTDTNDWKEVGELTWCLDKDNTEEK